MNERICPLIEETTDPDLRDILIRAAFKEFFSMIEADLYLINQFNPYPGFDNMAPLVAKFKKTYRQHRKDFKKREHINSLMTNIGYSVEIPMHI